MQLQSMKLHSNSKINQSWMAETLCSYNPVPCFPQEKGHIEYKKTFVSIFVKNVNKFKIHFSKMIPKTD